ncbi:GumC family protein [Larkinella soli]|uniref:GumC family protein n=1 Tax=Larkinella soli TaxID=1770527 RepID=UPI000FFC006B|nr:tyrosine-protein kinase [Larkinella soli]
MATNEYTYATYRVHEVKNASAQAVLMRHLSHWPWFLLSIGAALIGASIYTLYQQPVYKVQASLLIKDDKKGLSEESVLKELSIFTPKKVVENEIEILRSRTLMTDIVSQLGIDVQYFGETPWGMREIYKQAPVRLVVERPKAALYETELKLSFTKNGIVQINEHPYPINQSVDSPYGRIRVFARHPLKNDTKPMLIRVYPRSLAVTGYLDRLKVEPTSKASTVLQISLEDPVPEKGEAIINQLIMAYNKAAVVDKNRVAYATLHFIENRLRLISGELAAAEKRVESYKAAQGITDLGTQAQSFLLRVQQNDAQLNQTDIQLGILRDVENYVNSKIEARTVTPATLGLNDPILLGLLTRLTELEAQHDEISRTTSIRNPLLQTLESQIKAARTSISENLSSMKQMLSGTRQHLVSANLELESTIRTLPHKERALVDITRQQYIKNNLYTYLLEKREETALSYASTVSDSRIVDPASSGDEPVKPVKRMIYLLFGVFGLLFPVGIMSVYDLMNDRVNRRSEVESATSVPILGEVMHSKNRQALVVQTPSRSVISEQIRALRTNLQFLRSHPRDSQVVLFTSSISGEGKSFISLNLGASLALVNQTTVILEMDLRKPKLHSLLGIKNAAGLSNYLIGEAGLEDVLQPVPGFPNYWIITSGPLPPNPTELMSTPRLSALFEELRQRFAFTIVDSSPIGLVTDAQLIAPFADSTLYVVRHDMTPKVHLRMLDSLNKDQRFPRLGIILNDVQTTQAGYYNYNNNYYTPEPKSAIRRLIERI